MRLFFRMVVVGAVLTVAAAQWIPAPSAHALQDATTPLSLPPPTGPHLVGTTSLHLIDYSRIDPLAPTPRVRELMVRLWYPAAHGRQPRAAYLTPGVNFAFTEFLRAVTGADLPDDLLSFPTNSLQDPVALPGARRPIVLFSHGLGFSAAINTALHEELASRGYVVAGIDHTFDDGAVEFPDGRIEVQRPGLIVDDLLREVRAGDLRFVLDQLTALAAGRNPDAGNRPLPRGLDRVLDLTRVGAFGHSLGGPSVIGAMNQDRRIDAGVAMDGTLRGPISFDRPFLMMGNQHERQAEDPDWADFYNQLRGPRLHLVFDGAEHADLTDITVFKSTIDFSARFTTGPIDGERSVGIQRKYLVAWFDWALRGRARPLLRGESPRFPEVDFQP